MAETYLKIWRCTDCQKWSHAKRMPQWHKRFVNEQPLDESTILSYDPGVFDHLNGQLTEEGYWIKCGPFEPWWAVKI